MADIENQKYFLQLLVYNDNKKQNLAIVKEIDNNQYTILKDIANDVLDEIIPLNSQQYKILVQYKTFIRKLGREKVSKSLLTKNLQVIKELAKLIINGNETCEKTNASSCRRMGKNKKQHPQISQVSSVEVEQSPQMKKVMEFGNNITMNKKMKQRMKQNMKQKLTVRMKERLKEKKNVKTD